MDLCGIIKPDILNIVCAPIEEKKRRDLLRVYLLNNNVRYLAVYSSWFPWIIEDNRLQKVFSVHLDKNTAAGCDTMDV